MVSRIILFCLPRYEKSSSEPEVRFVQVFLFNVSWEKGITETVLKGRHSSEAPDCLHLR